MYLPKHFTIEDQQEIFSFIRANAFGQLISTLQGRLISSHIPLLLNQENNQLVAHLARPNPQLKEIDGQEVLVTLQGLHDYISPNWYENPGVPTWNYQAVHVYGICHVVDDDKRLRDIIESLSAVYEASQPEPWQPEYPDSMLRGIVGIEIAITELQAKYKLSQNRPREDQQGVIRLLRDRGNYQLADLMAEHNRLTADSDG